MQPANHVHTFHRSSGHPGAIQPPLPGSVLSNTISTLGPHPYEHINAQTHPLNIHQQAMGQNANGQPSTAVMVWGVLSTASMAASAYHGYRRNNSVGWALWWGLMGAWFPVITPAIAIAQGFGKRRAGR